MIIFLIICGVINLLGAIFLFFPACIFTDVNKGDIFRIEMGDFCIMWNFIRHKTLHLSPFFQTLITVFCLTIFMPLHLFNILIMTILYILYIYIYIIKRIKSRRG